MSPKDNLVNKIKVQTDSSMYNVYTGPGIIKNKYDQIAIELAKIDRAMVVVDTAVYQEHQDTVDQLLASISGHYKLVKIESTEEIKSWEKAGKLLQQAAEYKLHRFSYFIGIGGGVIGDLLGFVAATYMRGSFLIHVPTTLLAQVDSSIGGKVAVNHGGYKNIVGAFHQPSAVIADTDFLTTLPDRELVAGLAEVFKYGILRNRELFECTRDVFVKKQLDEQLQTFWNETTPWMISTSCKIKAEIVAADEQDLGDRMLLNLGHTFAHILESYTEYRYFKHGEAVAWGLAMAADLAHQKQLIAQDEYQAIIEIPTLMPIPTIPKFIDNKEKLCELLMRDKKVDDTGVRVVLPTSIGSADIFYCEAQDLANTILKWQ